MPDNHIYRMVTDRFGYLWIGTPKGLVKYNGYDFRIFTMADGLANDDVWDLYEDQKGRMWLGCRSPEPGYLYNNRYYRTYVKNSAKSFFPVEMSSDKQGNFHFASNIITNIADFYAERHDTIIRYNVTSAIPKNERLQETLRHPIVMPSGYVGLIQGSRLYSMSYSSKADDTIVTLKFLATLPESFAAQPRMASRNIGDYMTFAVKNNVIQAWNVKTGVVSHIPLTDYSVYEKIHYLYPDRNDQYLYAVCDSTLIRFDRDLRFVRKVRLSAIIPTDEVDGSKIHTVLHSPLWKNCIGTTTNGVYVNNEIINHFIRLPFDLKNHNYIGKINDSIFIWWNQSKKKLAVTTGKKKIISIDCPDIPLLSKAVLTQNGSILLGGQGFYILKNNKCTLVPDTKYRGLFYDFLETETGDLLGVANFGILEERLGRYEKTLYKQERYKFLFRDPLAKNYWAYNTFKIFVFNDAEANHTMTSTDLRKWGILGIEKIVSDSTYGNIILKDHNSIFIFNRQTNAFQKLFDSYSFGGALIEICNNTLVVAGGFGVLFFKITGWNSFTQPVLCRNLQNINYRQVYGITSSGNNVMLQTDKGVYAIRMPSDTAMLNATAIKNDQFRLILNYRDTMRGIRTGDTIMVNQVDQKLLFDVINPNGTGRLKYHIKLTGHKTWSVLNSNEINLPSWFVPDQYYTLYLVAQDDAWTSPTIKLKLYIQPHWWQTKWGRRTLWSAAVLSVLALLGSSILITRKLVLQAAQKRNLRMELELKAIYAQINPHFIFNTLNSGLLLVSKGKMEDAYTHISKFSRLLRSYIKSSRNKYISINDEIDNLEDYIELQQTRFKNKFSYEILVDPSLDPTTLRIPALLLQPFVENAINHGILPKEQQGHLKIEFRVNVEKDEILCIVEDDGVGRKHSNEFTSPESERKNRESYGDLLIKDLVSIFNKYEHMNIAIDYTDKAEPLTGTIVYIKIRHPHHGK